MRFKTLMIIKAVVCVGFSPVLLFFPAWIIGLLGAAFSTGAALTAREYGATLMGNFLLTWLARNIEEGVGRRAIVWNLFVYDAIALTATVWLLLSGVLNWLGWGIAVIYLFFAAGFGYFALRKQESV